MFVLFETAAGIAIFDAGNELKPTPDSLKLVCYEKYKNIKSCLKANNAIIKSKIPKLMKKAIKKKIKPENKLAVYDKKIGSSIKKKFGIDCVAGETVDELFRVVKQNFETYFSKKMNAEMNEKSAVLPHLICKNKLKISTGKVDKIIIQAISLVDEVEKELNTYLMRIKEWYGWHFPELSNIISDSEKYVKVATAIGKRQKTLPDLSMLVDEETEKKIIKANTLSMGTEIDDNDEINIKMLCDQFTQLALYKASLNEYLTQRMKAICPNISILVGEMVGARLIAKAGSLLNLAKSPSSTIQIFGAEKALFRALKTKAKTPKYGLIYSAKFINSASNTKKGKAARMLAAKVALGARVDALSKNSDASWAKGLLEKVKKSLLNK